MCLFSKDNSKMFTVKMSEISSLIVKLTKKKKKTNKQTNKTSNSSKEVILEGIRCTFIYNKTFSGVFGF